MNKIETLKATIKNLEENKIEYDWSNSNTCNCGVVARTLCNTNNIRNFGYYDDVTFIDKELRGVFSRRAFCMTSNLPLQLVFQKLKDTGFTHLELLELEYLGNPLILKKLKWQSDYNESMNYNQLKGCQEFTKKENLIKYLKAWVEILEKQLPKYETKLPETKARERISYVAVPETITEQMELILN